jgi:NAD(P)H-dependent FMN reductase
VTNVRRFASARHYEPEPALRVVALSGSLRSRNLTRRALEIALRGAELAGASTRLVDLSTMEMAFCDERSDESTYPSDVSRLRDALGGAHGILLGSPEYHGSMSGVLKNALDLVGTAELGGKMVGLVAVAGGSQSAVGTLSHMRLVCRHLHAWVVPRQVSISRINDAFSKEGHLKEASHEERLIELGRDVARYAALHFGIAHEK